MNVTFPPSALETTFYGNSFVRCPFLDPIAKVAGAPCRRGPQVPAQKADSYSDRFFSRIFQLSLIGTQQWWLGPSKLDEMPCSRDGF